MAAICLGDVFHRSLRVLLGNRCNTKVGAAIAGTKSKVQIAADAVYSIDGILYSKTAADNMFTFTDLTVQAAGKTCYYALCLDSSGTATVVNGTAVSTSAVTAGTAVATFPEVSDSVCVIGGLKIVTDSSHTFTPATTLLDATGVTATYFNFSCVPTAAYA